MNPIRTAILSTPRSGTHFLQSIFDRRPDTVTYGELNLATSKHIPEGDKKELLNILNNSITDEMKKNTMLVFIWNSNFNTKKGSEVPSHVFDKTILLQRKNKLHQYTSFKIAQKTNNWAGYVSKGKIVLNLSGFKRFLQKSQAIYEQYRKCISDYTEVFYEDLCDTDKLKGIMQGIDDFIGVEKLDYSKLEETPRSLFVKKQQIRPIPEIIINYQDFEEYDKEIIF